MRRLEQLLVRKQIVPREAGDLESTALSQGESDQHPTNDITKVSALQKATPNVFQTKVCSQSASPNILPTGRLSSVKRKLVPQPRVLECSENEHCDSTEVKKMRPQIIGEAERVEDPNAYSVYPKRLGSKKPLSSKVA